MIFSLIHQRMIDHIYIARGNKDCATLHISSYYYINIIKTDS